MSTDNIEDVLIVEDASSTGKLSISEKVFAAIITKCTSAVPEVAEFAHASFVDNISEMIGKKTSDRPVAVDIQDDCVSISVNIIIKFGFRIPTVAEKVQAVIRQEVEKITGKSVAEVNVIVSDLRDEDEADDKQATTDLTDIHP